MTPHIKNRFLTNRVRKLETSLTKLAREKGWIGHGQRIQLRFSVASGDDNQITPLLFSDESLSTVLTPEDFVLLLSKAKDYKPSSLSVIEYLQKTNNAPICVDKLAEIALVHHTEVIADLLRVWKKHNLRYRLLCISKGDVRKGIVSKYCIFKQTKKNKSAMQ